MHLPNGHQLQNRKYVLTNVIGQGGFGITYKGVWHTEVQGSLGKVNTNVSVCIKEYFFKDYCYRDRVSSEVKVYSETGKKLFHKFKEKLLKEASILSEVHHPYIVNVLEVFEENNTAYIAMEYIDGYSLKQRMEKESTLPEPLMLKYIHQIGEALQFVHEKNIIHLDIKPSNILIDKNDNARLIDFGVSKRYGLEEQGTSTTMLTLSKGFASIEQYDDEGTLTFSPRPDIYSLGATMYNLATGKIPTESILRATKELVKPSEYNPAITPKTEHAILKAMMIDLNLRYESVSEMMNDLDKPALISGEHTETGSHGQAFDGSEEDTTILNPPALNNTGDDDQTILNPQSKAFQEKKKSRKRILVPVVIFLFVLVSFAAVMSYINNVNAGIITKNTDQVEEAEKEQKNNTEITSQQKPQEEPEITQPVDDDNDGISQGQQETVTPAGNDEQPVVRESPALPAEEDKSVSYNEYLASGKRKYASEDYTGALDDFRTAQKFQVTNEIVRLEMETEEKIRLQEIKARKAQYEYMMSFGVYQIVKKISNGLYGAVDDGGNEIIPCKYISTGNTDGGKAFSREDLLHDIYNEDGKLIKEGVPYY